jgi:acyl carrier protein
MLESSSAAPGVSARVPAPPRGGPRDLADAICKVWAEALHVDRVHPDDNVFELGADSLIALQVVPTLEQRLDCRLSPIVCYEAPTPRMLATLVHAMSGGGRTADGSHATPILLNGAVP